VDNIFPHHENEIAQSEGATGRPFVRYWVHCAHLQVDGRKMAKSLGNFHTLRDLLARGHSGAEIRYVLLSGHYRQTLNFTFAALSAARAALARLAEFRDRLQETAGTVEAPAEDRAGALPSWAAEASARFRAGVEDDLNLPGALAALFDLVREGHRDLDGGGTDAGQAAAVLGELDRFDRVLGLASTAAEAPDEETRRLVAQRQEAREAGNWSESDRIRDRLRERGWDVRDTADGPKVKKRT